MRVQPIVPTPTRASVESTNDYVKGNAWVRPLAFSEEYMARPETWINGRLRVTLSIIGGGADVTVELLTAKTGGTLTTRDTQVVSPHVGAVLGDMDIPMDYDLTGDDQMLQFIVTNGSPSGIRVHYRPAVYQ